MGARVYDSNARGFLSVDPIDNLTQTFETNPYTYAGNDPIHAVDPAGLSPVTDQQLAEYRSSNGIGGTFHSVTGAVGHWFKNNWEYVAGGAMVVGGGVLIATGVGGPLGMMLVSAGADTIVQKFTTGTVDWGQVAISGVAGAIPGGGGVAGKVGAKALMTTVRQGAVSGAAGGSMSGAYGYARQPGPHSVAGFVGHTALGGAAGAGLGAAGGAVGAGISAGGSKLLAHVPPNVKTSLLRKVENTGAFSGLSERMSLRHVRNVAREAGIGLDGVKVKIMRDPDLIGSGFMGHTPDARNIHLYPDTFSSRTALRQTLGHERTHVYQLRTFGQAKSSEELAAYERAAYEVDYQW